MIFSMSGPEGSTLVPMESCMPSGDSILPIKKTLSHPRASLPERISFVSAVTRYRLQGYDILYLDESGFAVDSPRTHGYSQKGQRCHDQKNWHARGRINVIGAIIGFAFLTVSLFDCNINSDVFYAWLTQDLLPKLSTCD